MVGQVVVVEVEEDYSQGEMWEAQTAQEDFQQDLRLARAG